VGREAVAVVEAVQTVARAVAAVTAVPTVEEAPAAVGVPNGADALERGVPALSPRLRHLALEQERGDDGGGRCGGVVAQEAVAVVAVLVAVAVAVVVVPVAVAVVVLEAVAVVVEAVQTVVGALPTLRAVQFEAWAWDASTKQAAQFLVEAAGAPLPGLSC